MNPFIRHFPKERIIYFVRQAIEMLVSLRPYAACRTSATCPCPAASSRPVTGIAIGVLMGVDNYLLSMLGFALLFAVGISAVIGSGVSSADTIIGVFSSTGLALGVVLLSASGGFAKYSGYLIGDILTVQPEEIALLAVLLLAVLLVWGLFFNRFLLASINGDLAASKNIREARCRRYS